MAELAPADVEQFTGGLLTAGDPETQRMLTAALAVARRDVRWFVSPTQLGAVVTLNGHGGTRLRLPTKQVINLTSVTNDGVALVVGTDVILDPESDNVLINLTGRFSVQYAGIVVVMDHGFPENAAVAATVTGFNAATMTTADDWRQAILSLVVNVSQVVAAGRADSELESKQVDNVVYQWGATQGLPSVETILALYRLLYKWV